jgi:TetR/AcrR family transcriptional regulator, ethionamide resistance regulator
MSRIAARPTRATRAKQETAPKASMEDRMLAATERLLRSGHRFGALSVEQLTREAGVSRAAFYLHFRDKGDLVSRLVDHVTDEMIQSAGTWLSDAATARRADLQKAVAGAVATFKRHHAILEALSETAPQDESVDRLYKALIARISEQTRRSLATIKRKGLSRPAANDAVADALSGMLITYCVQVVGQCDEAQLKSLSTALGYIASCAAFADTA